MNEMKSWSVFPWGRYDADPPPSAPWWPSTHTDANRKQWEVSELVDPKWHAEHWHEGAQIHDSRRGICYRATVDQRGQLDHLEVLIDGYIDANALNRLGSVPIERITRATNLQVIAKHEAGDGGLAITLEGGLSDGDGSPYSPPSADELKELLEDHPTWWRYEVAAHYQRSVRTVDRWLRQAELTQGRRPLPNNSQTGRTRGSKR